MSDKIKIAIFGLGYVGLPLLINFSKFFKTIGYDIDKNKNIKLRRKYKKLEIVDSTNKLKNYNFFIVCVPTPLKTNNKPDLSLIKKASKSISKILNYGSYIIYESTVYPGVTEDICIPILEKYSKLKYNKDFFVGYSPERINPGDKIHNITNIKKVISSNNSSALKVINKTYKKIVKAGTYLAPSIKVAEAAKVIENTQRDINIAFINEITQIFDKLNISIFEVLKTANTKWNFLDFKPGLVGGHCIGIDPYYLSYIAEKNKIKPKMILSGRNINEGMAYFVYKKIKKIIPKKNIKFKILILGITFKENVDDFRNSKIFDLYNYFKKDEYKVSITDPNVDIKEVKKIYDINILNYNKVNLLNFNLIILAVPHKKFKINYDRLTKKNIIIYDLKNFIRNKNIKSL